MEKIIQSVFTKEEILSLKNFYKFTERKKIIVFAPVEFVEKLVAVMSSAGAGLIGNYEMCSFRTNGTGTFRPNSKAKPYSGKKNELTYSEEFKIEMECNVSDLNDVIDSVLENHPYDETVYEIYDFKKRGKSSIGKTIVLKSELKFSKLIGRLNKSIQIKKAFSDYGIKKIVFTKSGVDDEIIKSAEFINCDCIITKSKNKLNLIKL
jgi:hypothetical protein